MTMKIEVTIPESEVSAGCAAHYLAQAMSAIGFGRAYEAAARDAALHGTGAVLVTAEGAQAVNLRMSDGDAAQQKAEAVAATEAVQAEAPKRERGKPAPGRARRTKEEIAEDEAADKADAAVAEQVEATANISTGEERIDPTTAVDAAQDAADEAAEVEASKAKELTQDDVRAALTKYLNAFGTPAAMEDGPKVLALMFGADVTKVSQVPADQASLAKAVAGIEEMLAKNPYKREAQL